MLRAAGLVAARRRGAQRACARWRVTVTWGDGGEGQLGHSPIERSGVLKTYWELVPREVEGAVPFRSIACGTNHTLAIDESGGVWSWGKAEYGKLGHGSTKSEVQESPKKIEALSGVAAEAVACGEFHSMVVDTEGRLYTWGWGGSWLSGSGHLGHGDRRSEEYPKLVRALDAGGYRVASVCGGEAHTLILTDDGETLSCGAGEHGRQGNGGSHDVLSPEPVEVLEAETAVEIRCGAAHNVVLTDRGTVWVWGRNDAGQLGVGAGLAMDVYSMEDTPSVVERPDSDAGPLRAATITAGHSHTACVGTDGKLWFWGMKEKVEPYVVPLEARPSRVFAGGNYTIVQATDGAFYSFGLGRTNCLGHGDRQGHTYPKRIEALDAYSGVDVVACGFRHVALLADAKSSSSS